MDNVTPIRRADEFDKSKYLNVAEYMRVDRRWQSAKHASTMGDVWFIGGLSYAGIVSSIGGNNPLFWSGMLFAVLGGIVGIVARWREDRLDARLYASDVEEMKLMGDIDETTKDDV